jgi:hypothetical protein
MLAHGQASISWVFFFLLLLYGWRGCDRIFVWAVYGLCGNLSCSPGSEPRRRRFLSRRHDITSYERIKIQCNMISHLPSEVYTKYCMPAVFRPFMPPRPFGSPLALTPLPAMLSFSFSSAGPNTMNSLSPLSPNFNIEASLPHL